MSSTPYMHDCKDCGTRHGLVYSGSFGHNPSPVAEAMRASYARWYAEVQRFARKLHAAFGNSDSYSSSQIRELAKWCVRLPSGEMPERVCEGCGSREGVRFESGRTQYGACDAGANPEANRDVRLCRECAAEHHAQWDEMWAEYRYSQGV